MTTRVRLTEAAATRSPDLAGQTGIPVGRDRPGSDTDWVFVVWPDPRGAAYEPRHTWLQPADVETVVDEAT